MSSHGNDAPFTRCRGFSEEDRAGLAGAAEAHPPEQLARFVVSVWNPQ
jgi:hypothetical protein